MLLQQIILLSLLQNHHHRQKYSFYMHCAIAFSIIAFLHVDIMIHPLSCKQDLSPLISALKSTSSATALQIKRMGTHRVRFQQQFNRIRTLFIVEIYVVQVFYFFTIQHLSRPCHCAQTKCESALHLCFSLCVMCFMLHCI